MAGAERARAAEHKLEGDRRQQWRRGVDSSGPGMRLSLKQEIPRVLSRAGIGIDNSSNRTTATSVLKTEGEAKAQGTWRRGPQLCIGQRAGYACSWEFIDGVGSGQNPDALAMRVDLTAGG